MASGVSPAVNRLVNVIVCVGASIVIVGAMFKIQHWPGSSVFLPLGLGIEAVIFLVYAFLPPPDSGHETAPVAVTAAGNPALKNMEKMLQDADITPANLSKLSAGFQKLGTTVEKMGEISDVVKATGDYTQKTKEAAIALTSVKDAYVTTANSLASFNNAAGSTQVFHEQVQVLTKNLSSLNTIYELELQESNNHLKALNQFYSKLAEASAAMSNSADDAVSAQKQIAMLATNLGKLNQIYGNMLTAMQGR
ncbi:type IX secretion system motor protein PorL/GldL [Deminuibacter soli]|uniref:Gliding motility protein GldL n=1 Tax=Deminuibacter soli TaxID=2291815 RepID=A0A3E1NF31_9BACT|nr:gliding motility protein GldL [Deminuibacter soli]RFM26595.1 gliding motility protein GldL [Deminuibacter soli]